MDSGSTERNIRPWAMTTATYMGRNWTRVSSMGIKLPMTAMQAIMLTE